MAKGLVLSGFRLASVAEAQAEVERELQVRERCFGKWIDDGKLSAFDANERYARLHAAAEYLDRLQRAEADDTMRATLEAAGLLVPAGGAQ